MQITVPDAATQLMLELVASYGAVEAIQIEVVAEAAAVEFEVDGQKLSGKMTAARAISTQSTIADQLLGGTAEEQAQVAEWLTFSQTHLSPLMDDRLAKLNDWLESRTWLVGKKPTLADLVIYAAVQPAAVRLCHGDPGLLIDLDWVSFEKMVMHQCATCTLNP